MSQYGYLSHHGIKGQRWGVKNGPPYPLGYEDHNKREKQANSKKSLSNYGHSKLTRVERLKVRVGNKIGHYTRNEKNVDLPKNDKDAESQGWTKLSSKKSAMHQFSQKDGVENSKWISKDGHREVVFTGKGKNQKITKDHRDIGTYNYYDPNINPFKHTVYDVIPYIVLGNDIKDSTTAYDRVFGGVKNFMKKKPGDVDISKGKDKVDKIVKR